LRGCWLDGGPEKGAGCGLAEKRPARCGRHSL
jgi:hypothetical protein